MVAALGGQQVKLLHERRQVAADTDVLPGTSSSSYSSSTSSSTPLLLSEAATEVTAEGSTSEENGDDEDDHAPESHAESPSPLKRAQDLLSFARNPVVSAASEIMGSSEATAEKEEEPRQVC
jgi:hypothetical protein